ncbi:MAG: NAD(P)/FAD-dependent oxidoreductase [Candidatus Brocadiia bacterium]
MRNTEYLIIGNSTAAVGAVESIRGVDTDRDITVLSREPEHTYSRPLISYLLAERVDEDGMYYRPSDFYEQYTVTPLLNTTAVNLDVQNRVVESDREGRLRYGKLLLATGGKPILPPDVDGIDSEGVFTFTTWQDARDIKTYITRHDITDAIVVGGGLIGLKSMEALVQLGLQTTVVELAGRVLGSTFDATASTIAREAMERAGVDVRCNTTVDSITCRDGRVDGAVLTDGEALDCGLIIFAIGVTPNTTLVQDSPVDTDRGILVDERMRTSAPHVYAAGDVAQARALLSDEKLNIPIFPNAYRQGATAGAAMAGDNPSYEGTMAMNSVDIFGLPTISVGITAPENEEKFEILSECDRSEPSYRKIVLRDNRIVGAIFIGQVDRAGIFTGLARGRVDVSQFKDRLLTDDFGLISLPQDYRNRVISGHPLEV